MVRDYRTIRGVIVALRNCRISTPTGCKIQRPGKMIEKALEGEKKYTEDGLPCVWM